MPDNEPQWNDLSGIDLSKLDLDHIELEIEKPPGAWRHWAGLLLIVTAGASILWLPRTDWYLSSGGGGPAFFLICTAAMVVGVLGGRWLWAWAVAAAEAAARRAREKPIPEGPPQPPSALRRWLTFVAAVGGMILVTLGLPAMGYMESGEVTSSTWFVTALVAVVAGVLLGRWLMMQANAGKPETRRPLVIRLPPWFKYVTLGIIVSTMIAITIGTYIWDSGGDDPGSTWGTIRFSLGAVGMGIGITAAIWLARRFDEAEAKARSRNSRPTSAR